MAQSSPKLSSLIAKFNHGKAPEAVLKKEAQPKHVDKYLPPQGLGEAESEPSPELEKNMDQIALQLAKSHDKPAEVEATPAARAPEPAASAAAHAPAAPPPFSPLTTASKRSVARKTRAAPARKTRAAALPSAAAKFDFRSMSSRFDSIPSSAAELDEELDMGLKDPVPPTLGVKVSCIVGLFPPEQVAHMSTEEVYLQLIKPQAGSHAFVDGLPAECVGPAASFVVYGVADLWSDLMDALRGTPGDQERFVWVDMLCYGFGEARNARKSSVVDRAAAAAALAVPALNDFLSVASVLQRVERVEVLLTQPEAPPALRSLNCVFELFVGAKLNLPIVPLMVPEEREFLKSLVVSGQANADFFATLRGTVNLTKPRDASQELIVGKIAQLGDQVVRAYVHQVLKACFLDVAGEAAGGVQGLSVEAQRVHHAMGLCHQTFGNVVDAQAAFEKSIEAGRAAFGPEHRYVVQDLMDLGNLLYVHGSYEAALLKYEEALAIKTKQLGGMHKDVSRLLNRVGMVHKSMGNRDAAREKFAAALEADKDLYGGNDHPEVASDLANLGQLALDGNDYGEAKRCFELAFQIDSKVLGASHPDVAIDLANLGTLASIQGNFAEAEPLFTRALQLRVAALGEDALLTAQSQNILAYLWRKMGSEGKAMELGGRALDTYEEKLGPSHAFTLALAELWDGA